LTPVVTLKYGDLDRRQQHILCSPPVTGIEHNASRVDCPNNELASESAAECIHTQDDWQKEWTHCFNSVTDSARLEENLAEFFKEAKTIPYIKELRYPAHRV